MMRAIRQLRQRSALAVALSDLTTKVDVATQMQWLSSAAETAVRATVRYLFDRAAGLGQCPPPTEDMADCVIILSAWQIGRVRTKLLIRH